MTTTGEQGWAAVDDYLVAELVTEAPALVAARDAGRAAGLPAIEVSPTQGRFLALLCRMTGARRVLEFGTLAGYSTLWFADAVGPDGHVTTLELDPHHAEVARGNFARAGVADRVRLLEGPAAGSAARLVADAEPPFDLVFIDADKPGNARYLELALELSRPGTVVVVDNVVRRGAVADAGSDDPAVRGSRAVLHALGTHPRLDATALQTVGAKGWDGFALALVRG